MEENNYLATSNSNVPSPDAEPQSPPINHSPSSPPDAAAPAEQPTPPPPSTRLIVDRAPDVPALVSVDSTSMSVQWSPVSITVKSTHIRVVECLEAYALEMQQVEVLGPSGPAEVREDRWSVQYSGPATYVQVKGLRPGRNYAVRVVCKPIVTDPEVVVDAAAPSDILVVRTLATPPCAPAVPTLAQRQRNSLKFKWSEPSENGGHPIQAYALELHPPPEGNGDPPTAEGMFEVYRGTERNTLIKRLVPGVRYSVRVKAVNCIGQSPFSPIATFTTQASVPGIPEPPTVTSSAQDSVVLRWPPTPGNGSEVTGYQVRMDDGQGGDYTFVGHTREPHFAVAGLRSGLSYRFCIQAENSEGRSVWSAPCVARTAAMPPPAPSTPFRQSFTHSSISIGWNAPEYDGGSPLLRYEVEMQPKCAASARDMPEEWMRVYEGRNTACTLGALRAGCTYRVRLRAVNAQGAGAYSFPADVATSPACPEAPGAPNAISRTQNALGVQWGASPHDGGTPITSYRLDCRAVGAVEQRTPSGGLGPPETVGSFETVYEGAERQVEVAGLESGMWYDLRVSAANKQGSSPWSAVAVFATKPGLPLPPDQPSIAYGTAPRSLELRWERPYGRGASVDSYIVQMAPAPPAHDAVLPFSEGQQQQQQVQPIGEGVEMSAEGAKEAAAELTPGGRGSASAAFVTVYHGSDANCIVSNLEPNCEYIFKIRSCNSVGASPWGQEQLASTAPAAPSAPLNPRCAASTHDSLSLKWDPPAFDYGAAVTTYQLEYASFGAGQRGGGSTSWKSVYKGDAPSFTVDRLRPGKSYRARVRALNSCGWGPWCEPLPLTTQTDVPDAPEAPTTSGRTGTSVRLSWAPPLSTNGAPVEAYELQEAQRGSDVAAFSTIFAGNDITHKASQLSYGTTYAFRVRAVNAVGSGQWSPAVEVTTSLMPPAEPSALQAEWEEAGGGGVLAKWEAPQPTSLRAVCTSYELECTPVVRPTQQRQPTEQQQRSASTKPPAPLVKQMCSGKATQFKMTGLKGGTQWSVRVRAIGAGGAGHGGWSEAVSVTVPSDEKPKESTPHSRKKGSDALVLTTPRSLHRRGGASDVGEEAAVVSLSGDSENEWTGGRGQRVSLGGKRTAVAKAKPRQKTWLTPVSRATGVRERDLQWTVYVVGAALCCIILALLLRTHMTQQGLAGTAEETPGKVNGFPQGVYQGINGPHMT